MLVKLPASKKAINNLQQKLDKLVDMLLNVDNKIDILPFDKDTELKTIITGIQVPKV